VTPTGVRDGDPEALAGLCDVRGPAVLAYCEVIAGRGERGAAAAIEAFGSFRAGVVHAGDLATLNPEALLISATRHAAARHASSDVPDACSRVPGLLAARADRSISLVDHDWLKEHLETCWTCRAPVARFEVADNAYRDPSETTLPADVKSAMVAAMVAAAPVAPVEVPHHANGNSAHAEPDPAPPQEPYTAYDMPALELVDQPTSAYEMPAEDLAPPEPSDGARRGRPRGSGSLLGALRRSASAGGDPGSRAARRARAAGARDRRAARGSAAPLDAYAATPDPRAAPGTATPAADAHPEHAAATPDPRAAGGAALPRPRRELSRRPTRRGRKRGMLRPAIVLPVALVVIAIIVALAIAGVFGGGEPASVPQSYAPASTDAPTNTRTPPVVVVPGAASVSAAAVEKAKARRRAAKRTATAAEESPEPRATAPAATAPPPPPAAKTPPPPPPPPPARNTSGSGGGTPKIDAGNGATGAEQLPPAKDTSSVPDLAPPVEPVTPPPG
jgi:hypothetical protein